MRREEHEMNNKYIVLTWIIANINKLLIFIKSVCRKIGNNISNHHLYTQLLFPTDYGSLLDFHGSLYIKNHMHTLIYRHTYTQMNTLHNTPKNSLGLIDSLKQEPLYPP